MLIEYHRPKSEPEALELLKRETPITVPLGGGTILSKTHDEVAVVDLQYLHLDKIEDTQNHTQIGSSATLESMRGYFGNESSIGKAIVIEAGKNIRGMATLGGTLVSNGGRSALLTILVALDAILVWKPEDKEVSIDEWLTNRNDKQNGNYISSVLLPKDAILGFESIGRSPLDQPVICCAVAKWTSGKMRIALGGFGEIPTLTYEGDEKGDFLGAVETCLQDSGDEWAGAEYRMEAGKKLVQRLVKSLAEGK